MESKDQRVLKKILCYTKNIMEYSNGISKSEDLENNSMVAEAICFDILQIGELAKNSLSAEMKLEMSSIPWGQINGLRNRIVHGYGDVDFDIIFETIKDDIPELSNQLSNYIKANKKRE